MSAGESADATLGPDRTSEQRAERGRAVMAEVMQCPLPEFIGEPGTLGHLAAEQVFGGLWERLELTRRERRLVTLTVLAVLGQDRLHAPLHIKAALDSDDLTEPEVREVAVQVAYYAGWPLASSFDAAVDRAVGRHDAYDMVSDLATGPARSAGTESATAGPGSTQR
ncbi:carboxymuconolactone decarboxylase family protein [Streptomyces diacarni]|uniref:carboxymuconolactone decarboxylase family protein n=1 Tax=Streptomyces diacarni TaxID=2800381 RepID=UPI0034015A5D